MPNDKRVVLLIERDSGAIETIDLMAMKSYLTIWIDEGPAGLNSKMRIHSRNGALNLIGEVLRVVTKGAALEKDHETVDIINQVTFAFNEGLAKLGMTPPPPEGSASIN